MSNRDANGNPKVVEHGIKGGDKPQLNERGIAAVNAYLSKFALWLVVGNITLIGGVFGWAFVSVQAIKSKAKTDIQKSIESARIGAREAAIATALTAVKEEKSLQEAAIAAIGNSVDAARSAGNLEGIVGQIRTQLNGLQPRIEEISLSEKTLREDIDKLQVLLSNAKDEEGYVKLIEAIQNLRNDSKESVTLLNRLEGIFDKKQSIGGESGFITSGPIAICFGKLTISGSGGPTRSFEVEFPVDFIKPPFVTTSINSSIDTGFAVYGHTLTRKIYSGSLVTVGDKNNHSISSGASVKMHYIAIGMAPIDGADSGDSNTTD